MGSALDIYIHNKITRPYMVDNNEYSNKTCYFKNFEFNNNINILKEFSDKEQESIPKIIHYCWFGGNELTDLAKRCINSWKLYCPDYKIIRWDESNFDVNSNQFCKEAYDNKKWAFVTDYVRLMVLHNYGGIYMDTDVEVIKSLDDFLKHEAFSGFESSHHMPTGIIASRKENKWIKILLDDFNEKKFIINDKMDMQPNVVKITNLTKNYYPLKLNDKYQDLGDLTLYPSDWFCPKNADLQDINLTVNTHAIHHFDGSWLPQGNKQLIWKQQMKYYSNENLISLIKFKDQNFNVLEINCLLGETLISLKNKFNNINVFGQENNTNMINILRPYINIEPFNNNIGFNNILFDIIIAINEVNKDNIINILNQAKSKLKYDGTIITMSQNIMNYNTLTFLKQNDWEYKNTNIKNNNFYTTNTKCSLSPEFIILYKNNEISKGE